jgi:hypothetical protein|tara:strand:+ start:17280 stop:17864 length:585 start_codon:yes stop_codon:yes gene_type:complete
MKIYTQINQPSSMPEGAKWLPCLKTSTVPHRKAWKQSLLITHYDPIKHYEYDIVELLDEKVYCIGGRTYDRLVDLGFTKVKMLGSYADDIKIQSTPALTPCTWLHGDKFARDFSKYTGVTAIQTYQSSLYDASLLVIRSLRKISSLYVYSSRVLEALEINQTYPQTKLFHTESCKPNAEKWLETESFYPGNELD